MSTSVPRWAPSTTVTRRGQMVLARVGKHRRLFAFLHQHRSELFDDAFQDELATMYRDFHGGKLPVPPALLAMATLLQAYTGVSDAEAVEMTVLDLRWQLVLDVLGAETPAFGQHTLQAFRERLIRHDMDRRLLERTVELAKKTQAFDWKKLQTLRLAIDSRPLEGAGRVEDTFNLLGHAAFKLLRAAANLLQRSTREIAACAEAPAFLSPSIKSGLDIDWFDPEQKSAAIGELLRQIDALEGWIRKQAGEEANQPPLKELFETIAQLREQNIDPEPPRGGKPRIRKGVAKDRRVSVEDAEMRHGRKSKSKRFNGYKQHIANDVDTKLILACSVTKANRPEGEGAADIEKDLARSPRKAALREVLVDRAYVSTELVAEAEREGAIVLCKPRNVTNGEKFSKADFKMNFRLNVITCPAGQTQKIRLGDIVEFDKATCSACKLRPSCTNASHDVGRKVTIASDEKRQQRLRKLMASVDGRQALRARVGVEHRLAHLSRKQGPRARYRGIRKNLLDLRRHAAVLNLEVIQRQEYVVANAA